MIPTRCLAATTATAALLLVLSPLGGQDRYPFVAPTDPLPPDRERQALKLPDGLRITLFASEPLIGKPMNIAFDARGRVWVTQSFEYPFPARNEAAARDRITVLEDTDGDGRADRATVFADRLNIPIGVLPVPGGAIAYSIPNVWRFFDDDGDDVADRREPILGPFGYADTHGMVNSFTWGYDGWVYACHGFANQSQPVARDGKRLSLHSGNTFRFPYDGGTIQQFTWGQVNPFGLAFDAYGDLYSADCHSRPIYLLLRYGYYPSFGKPHDGLGFVPPICTHDHGSTAIAGICLVLDDRWPTRWRDAVLTGNVVTNRIQTDRLRWHGATPTAEHGEDFVQSEDLWFRPVDIKLGPDGAVYVADFYNRIIGHYEVPLTHPGRDRFRGRIWRIEPANADTRWRAPRLDLAAPDELVEYLGHPNITVRTLAANELVWRVGTKAGSLLTAVVRQADNREPERTVHALWALFRLGLLDHSLLSTAARDPNPMVRAHVAAICGRVGAADRRRRALLRSLALDENARVQRAAVQAMAAAPHPEYVDTLHSILDHAAGDPLLRHATRIALRNHLRLEVVQRRWQRQVATAAGRQFADVARGLPNPAVAQLLLDWIERTDRKLDPAAAEYLAANLPAWELRRLVPLVARTPATDQLRVLQAIGGRLRARGLARPDALRETVRRAAGRALRSPKPDDVLAAIDLVEAFDLKQLTGELVELAKQEAAPVRVRARCFQVLASRRDRRLLDLAVELFSRPLRRPQLTLAAVDYAVAVGGGQAEQALRELLARLPANAAQAVISRLIGRRRGIELVLEEAEQGRVPVDVLLHPAFRASADRYPDLLARLDRLTRDVPQRDRHVVELIERLTSKPDLVRNADVKLGQQLFSKHCAPCHKLRGTGGDVGPSLDGIGSRGLQRLAEDVLDPNRNVDRSFWRTLIVLRDGRVLSGLLRPSDEGDRVVTLVDETAQVHRLDRSAIESMRRVRMSPMPSNFGTLLSEDELRALLGYLLQQSETEP